MGQAFRPSPRAGIRTVDKESSGSEVKEVLDDPHAEKNYTEGQTSNGKNAQEGQTGVRIKHRNQIGNGLRDPVTDGIENGQDGIQNSSSSLQKHTFQHKINILTVVHYGYILVAAHRFERDLQG